MHLVTFPPTVQSVPPPSQPQALLTSYISNAILLSRNSSILNLEAFFPAVFLLRPEGNHRKALLLYAAFGDGGFLLQDSRVTSRRAGGGRNKAEGSGAGGTLTTGLARAELALEEARELELRWPPCSEGCPHSPPPPGRRQKQRDRVSRATASAEAPSVEVSHVPCRKDRGEHREQAPLGKEGCVGHSGKRMPAKNRKQLVTILKEHRILG